MKVSAIAFAIVAAVIPSRANQTPPAHPDRLGVEITVSPVAAFSDAPPLTKPHFVVTAVIRQLETDEVIFAPKINLLAGTSSSVMGSRPDGTRLKGSFAVDGSSARYTIGVTRGEDQILLTSGTVQLTRE